MVFGVPFSITLAFFMLAFHVLFVFLTEWLTLLPCTVALPQTSHFAIIYTPPLIRSLRKTNTILTYRLMNLQGYFKILCIRYGKKCNDIIEL